MSTLVEQARDALTSATRILVFTGAGISTESGIPDFRGPDGLWSKMDPDDFTIQRYLRNRDVRVAKWKMHAGGELWGARSTIRPNRAHEAIVALEESGRMAGCVTQNIDGLHQVAGLGEGRVAELHGNTRRVMCLGCERSWPIEEILERVDEGDEDPHCVRCGGLLKTTTVMFGELLPEEELRKAWSFAGLADGVLVVGSTMAVYPACDIPLSLAREGRSMVIVNRGPTEADRLATVRIEGAAGEVLPDLVSSLTT